MSTAMALRVDELRAGRIPFVHATVVRAQQPTSARPGDDAIVLADGSIEGFVGGVCAEGSVRAAALGALQDGNTVLLRVVPDDATAFPESPGARVVVNPCHSGGALEIFLEPLLPPPLVHLIGTTPIAEAVRAQAALLGYAVRDGTGPDGAGPDGAVATIVASLGRDEVPTIRAALDAGVGFIGLVASPRRGAQVLAELTLTESERSRIHTPVGLDIGARTAAEIALSILAQIVQGIRREGLLAVPAVDPVPAPQPVIDPVCGMSVVIDSGTPHLVVDGVGHWFCGPGCRDHFAEVASVANP